MSHKRHYVSLVILAKGALKFLCSKEENANSVHFTLFRLGNRTLEALDVSARLGDNGQPVFQMPGVSTENDRDEENPDGLYGGWVIVLEGHLRRPDRPE